MMVTRKVFGVASVQMQILPPHLCSIKKCLHFETLQIQNVLILFPPCKQVQENSRLPTKSKQMEPSTGTKMSEQILKGKSYFHLRKNGAGNKVTPAVVQAVWVEQKMRMSIPLHSIVWMFQGFLSIAMMTMGRRSSVELLMHSLSTPVVQQRKIWFIMKLSSQLIELSFLQRILSPNSSTGRGGFERKVLREPAKMLSSYFSELLMNWLEKLREVSWSS